MVCVGASDYPDPGGDSPLSITANIAGILTFIYALAAGLYVYIAIARTSDARIFELAKSLEGCMVETRTFRESLEQKQQDATIADSLPLARELDQAIKRLYSRSGQIAEFSWKQVNTSLESPWYKRLGRGIQYVIVQKDLEKQISEKDRLRDDVRGIFARFEKAFDEIRHQRWVDEQRKASQELVELVRSTSARLAAIEIAHRPRRPARDVKRSSSC